MRKYMSGNCYTKLIRNRHMSDIRKCLFVASVAVFFVTTLMIFRYLSNSSPSRYAKLPRRPRHIRYGPFVSKNPGNRVRVHYVHWGDHNNLSTAFVGCEYDQCVMTAGVQSSYYDKDVVIFYGPSVPCSQPPPPKARGQVWVFYSQESPINHPCKFKQWDGLFNWTLTYRYDSDALATYGAFMPRTPDDPPEIDISTVFHNKTEDVAWWVTNCKSNNKREIYINNMKKYINVHTFGVCDPKRRCDHRPTCYKMLTNKYKYYIAFENSFCYDYASEKSFKLYMFGAKAIPLVRGGIKHIYEKTLPPHSYIHTADFDNVEQFTKYLNELGKNETAYKEYFEWQKYYKHGSKEQGGFCAICKLAQNMQQHRRIYDRFADWFSGGSYMPFCRGPTDL